MLALGGPYEYGSYDSSLLSTGAVGVTPDSLAASSLISVLRLVGPEMSFPPQARRSSDPFFELLLPSGTCLVDFALGILGSM